MLFWIQVKTHTGITIIVLYVCICLFAIYIFISSYRQQQEHNKQIKKIKEMDTKRTHSGLKHK